MGIVDTMIGAVTRLDSYRRNYGSATSPARESGTYAQGWANVQTGMGYSALDKGASTYFARPVELGESEIVDIYEGGGLARRIIDLPAQEAVRQGVSVLTDDDSTDEAVQDWMARLEWAPGQHGALGALEEWEMRRDLFGGAALALIPEGDVDTAQPLALGEVLASVRVLTRHDLQAVDMAGVIDPMAGEPDQWRVVGTGRVFHRSRLIMAGRNPLSRRLNRRQGWDVPAYVACWQALTGAATVDAAVPTIMSMFVTPVQSMRGFAKLIREGKIADVFALLGHEQLMQSMHRVRVIDADGEDYKIQTTSVAGLADLMDRMPERVCAVRGLPLTLLMGRSPGGLNATGESDTRFFYDSIKAGVQAKRLTPALRRLLDVAFADRTGPTGGRAPERYRLEWAPLYQLSDAEKEDLAHKRQMRDAAYIAAGVLTSDEVRQARFGDERGDVTLLAAPAPTD